ncbi:hypothetical protein BC628DRAFT_1420191 [Trametes gibbosa]|nr:hypothetical protein BC628DRAFT_1420191 [Trametes gibbosa]
MVNPASLAEGPRPASERVRKPTEKGKIYAETLTAKDCANSKDQDKDVAQKSGQKKSAHAAEPSQANDVSHKKVKKTKELVRPRHDEFQIETLPVNHTSMKSTAVDLRAYTRTMPHTPHTVGTADTKSAPATRKVAGQRQSPLATVVSTTSPSPMSSDRDGVCADYPVTEGLAKLMDGQRPRIKDYGADAQRIIAYSALLFKGKIVAENAYPDKLTERTWATTVWYHAAKHEAVELSSNSEILRLISRNSWVIRGELKAQDHNRQLAASLVWDRTFTYEIIDHAGGNHEGLYETPAIQMIVN